MFRSSTTVTYLLTMKNFWFRGTIFLFIFDGIYVPCNYVFISIYTSNFWRYMLKSVGMRRIQRSQSASLIFPPPRLPSESHRYFLFTCILKYLYPKWLYPMILHLSFQICLSCNQLIRLKNLSYDKCNITLRRYIYIYIYIYMCVYIHVSIK